MWARPQGPDAPVGALTIWWIEILLLLCDANNSFTVSAEQYRTEKNVCYSDMGVCAHIITSIGGLVVTPDQKPKLDSFVGLCIVAENTNVGATALKK